MSPPFIVYEWTGAGVVGTVFWLLNVKHGVRRRRAAEQYAEKRYSTLWLYIEITLLIASLCIDAIGLTAIVAPLSHTSGSIIKWGLMTLGNIVVLSGVLIWINQRELRVYSSSHPQFMGEGKKGE